MRFDRFHCFHLSIGRTLHCRFVYFVARFFSSRYNWTLYYFFSLALSMPLNRLSFTLQLDFLLVSWILLEIMKKKKTIKNQRRRSMFTVQNAKFNWKFILSSTNEFKPRKIVSFVHSFGFVRPQFSVRNKQLSTRHNRRKLRRVV